MSRFCLLITWMSLFFSGLLNAQPILQTTYDVVVIGGGASGTAAGITAARLGAQTLIVEEGPWLGGMLTSAGVSAFDGNHRMAGGIFAEFRDSLYRQYGGPKAVETGWVSNTLFEPKVGARIFKHMAEREPRLSVAFHARITQLALHAGRWHLTMQNKDTLLQIRAAIVIDATELGDVVAKLGLPSDIGMDSAAESGESFAPDKANDIVQDLTWVAILQEYPYGTEHLLAKPVNYNPDLFRCCCDTRDPSTRGKPLIDCQKMMEYGRLPGGKYMINWPNCGNDIYMNVVYLAPAERAVALQKARERTFEFVYFLQTELGFTTLGLAADEFPTEDRLPLIPYHRESRRIKGKARLLVNHILQPFDQKEAYYRTGIAVGDYPIDHHHKQNPEAPAIDFINIKAPSYNIPLGSLLPREDLPLIVAEKSISVSNIVNGTTRLQPVVLGIGQAAGTLAALASKKGLSPEKVSIRQVQQSLLDQGAYIMPYIDVTPVDADFGSIQRVGACGLLRGTGIPYKWANQTWFYPDSLCTTADLLQGLDGWGQRSKAKTASLRNSVDLQTFVELASHKEEKFTKDKALKILSRHYSKGRWEDATLLTRREVAVLLDEMLNPFAQPINTDGHFTKP